MHIYMPHKNTMFYYNYIHKIRYTMRSDNLFPAILNLYYYIVAFKVEENLSLLSQGYVQTNNLY